MPPRKKPSTAPSGTPARKLPRGLPSEAQVLEFLRDNPTPAGKREIARAFGLKGQDKIALKALLKRMEDAGQLDRGPARSFHEGGGLPKVTVLKVVAITDNGEAMGEPQDWKGKDTPPRVHIIERRTLKANALGLGDRVLARIEVEGRKARAFPIKKLERRADAVLGIVAREGRGWLLEPVDKRVRFRFRIPEEERGEASPGELVLAEPIGPNRRPGGRVPGIQPVRVLERLGDPFQPKSFSLIAIHERDIPATFAQAVLDEAEAAAHLPLGPREDLRDVPLITIDPADARDHDDAVWAEPDTDPANAGGWRLIVAIADVSFYVRPRSALDAEARERGNSVYFPDRVVPMLPEALSADVCSLKAGVDRACLACHLRIGPRGAVIDWRFSRAVMRSAASLAYEQAQAAIDGTPDAATEPLLAPVLRPLWAAWAALKAARDQRAPLELNLPERRITLDERGRVSGVAVRQPLPAHQLIEDFMIAANVAASRTLEKGRAPCLFRVHEEPTREKLMALKDFLDGLGVPLALGQVFKPSVFNTVLEKTRALDAADLAQEMVLRTQTQAYYTPENLGHFGLALGSYAHFTSPIRRYADLVVHRSLVRLLDLGEGGLEDAEAVHLARTAEHVSMTERRAMEAERATTDRYVAAWLADRVGETFPARLTGVTRFGLFATLEHFGGDGLIPLGSLGDERFQVDAARHMAEGMSSGRTFQLGQKVAVRLVEASPVTGGLRMEIVDTGEDGGSGAGPRIRRRDGGRRAGGPGRAAPRMGGPGGRRGR